MSDNLPLRGLDADQSLARQAHAIKAGGIDFVMRYLKNLTTDELEVLHAAGLAVGFIWESTATRALEGADAGTEDGTRALSMMRALGAPSSCVVYATVDNDVGADDDTDLTAIGEYFDAFDAVLWPDASQPALYRIGGYADGTVLSKMRSYGMPKCWLAGAMGWDGSREFEANEHPDLVQGPTLAHGGNWHGMEWPDLGFAYDPNLALVADFGGWASRAADV